MRGVPNISGENIHFLAPPTAAITTHDGMFVISLEACYLVGQLSEFLVVGLLFEAGSNESPRTLSNDRFERFGAGGSAGEAPNFSNQLHYLGRCSNMFQAKQPAPSRPTFSLELVNLNKKK